jgi:hypothetical protein
VHLTIRDSYIDRRGQDRIESPGEETISLALESQTKKDNPRFKSIRENRQALGELMQGIENHRTERDIETALSLAIGDFDTWHTRSTSTTSTPKTIDSTSRNSAPPFTAVSPSRRAAPRS